MCFSLVALASSNVDLLFARSRLVWLFDETEKGGRRSERAAIVERAKVFRHMSSNVTDNHARP